MPFQNMVEILDERADMMARMLETLGLRNRPCSDAAAASDLRTAARNCMMCRSTGECQTWIAEQDIVGRTSDPTFCPNYARFMEWQKSETAQT
ncbi:MAG: DUF6455 family protein [Pseudomonadota bacterium]